MSNLVSVVIITYKRPVEVLKRAIDSVLNQTYKNIELIVVNDCPEDVSGSRNIEELVKHYDNERICLIHHEHNKGANAARNTGLKNAKGKYIAYLDDDDEWFKEKIEKQYLAISKSERFGIAYCGFYRKTETEAIPCYPTIIGKRCGREEILEYNFVGGTSFSLLSIEAIRSVNGFDEKIKVCQEYELWIRILQNYDAVAVDELLGNYYYSNDSTFKDANKFINGSNTILAKHAAIYNKYPRALSNNLLHMFIYACKQRRWKQALHYKIQAIKVDAFNPNNFTIVLIMKRLLKGIAVTRRQRLMESEHGNSHNNIS